MSKARTRFAPSPTGYLHIGSLRTALFAYLAAKTQNGKVILRIEDTDQKRYVEGAVEKIILILDWIGIKFDEGPVIRRGAIPQNGTAHANESNERGAIPLSGTAQAIKSNERGTILLSGTAQADKLEEVGEYGPYIQSQRKEIYNNYVKMLLEKGEAYYCFCTSARLAAMRAEQSANKLPPRYDRTCRELSQAEIARKLNAGEKVVIRQKMPLTGEVIVRDELRGDIKFKAEDLEDHVLIKSNGMPTYHFALVVDDYLMKITHVIRGEEWLPSFPKNILLYHSFGWQPPKFYHLPLTLNKGGGKLSKRQGDVAVEDYKQKGYLPEALINFSALLSWHPKDDNEILSLADLEKQFKVEDLGTSPAVFDLEKLDYLNGYYIRHKSLDELTQICVPYLEKAGLISTVILNGAKRNEESRGLDRLSRDPSAFRPQDDNKKRFFASLKFKNNFSGEIIDFDYLQKVVGLEQERLKKLSEIGELTQFFFKDDLQYESELLIWKKMSQPEVKSNLDRLYNILSAIEADNWNKNNLEKTLTDFIENNNLKTGEWLWPLRAALTGNEASPGPFAVAEVLDKAKSLKRIKEAIAKL